MKHHNLKIKPEFFVDVAKGHKNFEVRINDRDFKIYDAVTLHEYANGLFTGRSLTFKVGYVSDFEQKKGFVVFALLPF